jgi:hypothetical protein
MSERRSGSRVDEEGRAYAGSQLQIQIYVSRREAELTRAVVTALGAAGQYAEGIRWVSPLEASRFAEVADGAFLGALELANFRTELSAFWPTGGPRWDGLGILQPGPGVLLVEAKSYPEEMLGSGVRATAESSRRLIAESLSRAKAWCGADAGADWHGPLYQYANRLAHVYFLREVARVNAWLVNLCFVDDPHKPTSLACWQQELSANKAKLGFASARVPYSIDVFLGARSRDELVGVL